MALQKKIITACILIVLSLIFGVTPFGSIFSGDINMIDEGQFGAWANHMLLGKKMFSDIYIVYGPLHVYPIYLWFKLFEPSAFAVRLILTLGGSLGIVAIYYILSYLRINNYLKYLSILAFLLMPVMNVRIAVTLWAIFLMLKIEDLKKIKGEVYFLLGVITSTNFLISQDFGVFLLILIFLNFSYLYIKGGISILPYKVAPFLLGVFSMACVFVFWAGSEGWLTDYLKTVLDVSTSLVGINTPNGTNFPNYINLIFGSNAWHEGFLSYEILLYVNLSILIFSLFFVILQSLKGKLEKNYYSLFIFTILGFLLFTVLLTRHGIGHYFYSLSPVLIVSVFLIQKLLDQRKRNPIISSILIAAFIVFILRLVYINNPSIKRMLNPVTYLNLNTSSFLPRLGPIDVTLEQERKIVAMQRFVEMNTNSKDTIFFFNDQPMYYMLVNRLNPTRYDLPFAANTLDKRLDLLNDLKSKKPKFIFIDSNVWSIDGIANAKRLPEIYDYISKNYKKVKNLNGVLIYEVN